MRTEITRCVPGDQFGRPGALAAVPRMKSISPWRARAEPAGQVLFGLGQVGVGDADLLKAQCLAPVA